MAQGPILITGATGMLGGMLLWKWREEPSGLAALVRSPQLLPPKAWPGVARVAGDITEPASLEQAFNQARPSLVVHCAAMALVDECQKNPEAAWRVNQEGSRNVAGAAAKAGAGLVYISTDAVYAQGPGPHPEEDAGGELSVYAQTKLAGERASLEEHSGALVLRVCIFGYNSDPARSSLAEWMLANLKNETPFPGFSDVRFSPIFTGELAPWLLAGARANLGGVYNMGSGAGLSKYEFGRRLAQGLGKDPGLVLSSEQGDVDLAVPRPEDPVMNSTRLFNALGAVPPGIDEQIDAFLAMKADGGLDAYRRFGGYA